MANDITRLGLGCMGMNMANGERSVATVRHALERGVTLLNTGEFYGGGESEMVLREAIAGVPRDSYFLSVKFGMLPDVGRGLYGIDVSPWHVRAHLAYSLHRLGLDYVDLYEPARMDESVPVEEVVGAVTELVKEGLVRNVGLTEVDAATLERGAAAASIHTVELSYSLLNRTIETNGTLDVARAHGMGVLAFGVLGHGRLLADDERMAGIAAIAGERGVKLQTLLQAYVWAKLPEAKVLIGTTSPEHLDEAIEALEVELTSDDLERIEAALPAEGIGGMGMRNFRFADGRFVR